MMNNPNSELLARLAEITADCRAKYEKNSEDPFLSNLLASKLESLQSLAERLQGGENPSALLAELQDILPRLASDCEREAECPSFDWYGEHYYYEVFSGQYEAYREVIALLREQA